MIWQKQKQKIHGKTKQKWVAFLLPFIRVSDIRFLPWYLWLGICYYCPAEFTVKWGMLTWSESPNCCLFANGAVDVHFPLLSSVYLFSTTAATLLYYLWINMSGHFTNSAWLNAVHNKRSNVKVKRGGGHEGKEVHVLSPLFLHFVPHQHMSVSLWSFSKVHSNKQKLLRRCATWKHRYTGFLLPCYVFIWKCWLIPCAWVSVGGCAVQSN